MATCIHPSRSCLLPYTILPSLKSTEFSFNCLLNFFGCTLHLFYTLRNIILPGGICLSLYCVVGIVYANFHLLQVNENFLGIKKGKYRDGVKRRETRKGWMGCMLPWR